MEKRNYLVVQMFFLVVYFLSSCGTGNSPNHKKSQGVTKSPVDNLTTVTNTVRLENATLIHKWELNNDLTDSTGTNNLYCNNYNICGPEFVNSNGINALNLKTVPATIKFDSGYLTSTAGQYYITSTNIIKGHRGFAVSFLYEKGTYIDFNTGDGQLVITNLGAFSSMVYGDRNGATLKTHAGSDGKGRSAVIRSNNINIGSYLNDGFNAITFEFAWADYDENTCEGKHGLAIDNKPVNLYVNDTKISINYTCDNGQARISPATWIFSRAGSKISKLMYYTLASPIIPPDPVTPGLGTCKRGTTQLLKGGVKLCKKSIC